MTHPHHGFPSRTVASGRTGQRGFTLIEIVSVVVILGILAAIAVPKYFDLQAESRRKAALSALAEGKSRIGQFGSKAFIRITSWPAGAVYTGTALGTDMGDFTASYSYASPVFTISVQGKANTSVASATAVGSIRRPGL